jgi:hypothetical protein
MAYMAFDAAADHAAASPVSYLRPTVRFTPTEWAVIRLAQRDGPATLRPATRLGTKLRRLFGITAANRLADPRLEALRRVAVRCRLGAGRIDEAAVGEFLSHGFGLDQLALVAGYARQVTRPRTA